MKEGIIISDYISQDNNTNNASDIKQNEIIYNISEQKEDNIIEIEKSLENNDIKILGLEKEKTKKIKIPKDIISEKKRSNK